MATTPIRVNGNATTTKVSLSAMAGATGTPAASYATTEVIAGVLYSATVAEALVGRFQFIAYSASDVVTGYGTIELADDTAVHHPGDLPSRIASEPAVNILMAAGGTLTDVPVVYDTVKTNPVLRVYRGSTLVSSPAAVGTGTTFYFDVAIPADAAVGEIIRVLTDEDPARVVLVGQVVSTSDLDSEFDAIKGSGFDAVNDSLKALRDRGDEAWTGDLELSTDQVVQGVIQELRNQNVVLSDLIAFQKKKQVSIVQGDDYQASDSRAWEMTIDIENVDFAGATALFGAGKTTKNVVVPGSASLVDPTVGSVTLRIEFDGEDTIDVVPDHYEWTATIVKGGRRLTVVGGPMVVHPVWSVTEA